MTRGTTPSYRIKIKGTINYENVEAFYVTVKQKCVDVTHSTTETENPVEIDEDHRLLVTLTQEETLKFEDGEADLQVRGKFEDGTAFASAVVRVPVKRVLHEGVI